MIKNSIIGILVVLCVVLSVYSLIQQTEARRFQKIAVQHVEMAARQAEDIRRQQTLAEASASKLHQQLLVAEQNLLECTQKAGKKK